MARKDYTPEQAIGMLREAEVRSTRELRQAVTSAKEVQLSYIGGVKPSLPTLSRGAVKLPSAAFTAPTNTLAPTFASA